MKVTIKGIPPYDGEYEFDQSRLTNRDLHTIKKITGYTPDQFEEVGADNDFVVALAIIAVRKSLQYGKVDEDAFWDAELGGILVDFTEDAAVVDGPPLSAPETQPTPSGAPSPTGGVDSAVVRSLAPTGTDSSAS